MKLDRTKPFGTVFGSSDHTYEQDGKWFDQEGNLVPQGEPEAEAAKAEDKPAKPAKGAKAPAEAAKAEDSQLNAQLGEA